MARPGELFQLGIQMSAGRSFPSKSYLLNTTMVADWQEAVAIHAICLVKSFAELFSIIDDVQTNYKANSCYFNLIVNTYKDQINDKRKKDTARKNYKTEYKKFELTVETLCEMMKLFFFYDGSDSFFIDLVVRFAFFYITHRSRSFHRRPWRAVDLACPVTLAI